MAKRNVPKPKYKKEYCQKLIDHMAKGLSMEAFAGLVGVCRKTVYNWREEVPEFKAALGVGKAKQILFFEKMGIGGMTGQIKNFNSAAYIFTLKNKLQWRDAPDQAAAIETKPPVTINIVKSVDTRALEDIDL